jgi:hypothetical protein
MNERPLAPIIRFDIFIAAGLPSMSAVKVLAALAHLAHNAGWTGKGGYVFAVVRSAVVDHTRLCARSVSRAYRELEDAGVIRTVVQVGAQSAQVTILIGADVCTST